MIERNAAFIKEVSNSGDHAQLEEKLLLQMELSSLKDTIAKQLGLVVSR